VPLATRTRTVKGAQPGPAMVTLTLHGPRRVCEPPCVPPRSARPGHAYGLPIEPASTAPRATRRFAPHASARVARHACAWRTTDACALPRDRGRRRARRSFASSRKSFPSPAEAGRPPTLWPSTARWRSPASSIARRACPRERARSPRGRTRRLASRRTCRGPCRAVLSSAFLSRAWSREGRISCAPAPPCPRRRTRHFANPSSSAR